MTLCRLCFENSQIFADVDGKKYYGCPRCAGIFLDPAAYIGPQKEKERYEQHNNDVRDPGYQKFVAPLVARVQEQFDTTHHGLDFGAGTGPVAAMLLRAQGFNIELYDPFFWDNPQALKKTYDFIICCEVIEHFQAPAKEFALLRSLLNPGGVLLCMSEMYTKDTDFTRWYYKNDPTHVFFYQKDTLAFIQSQFGFDRFSHSQRLIEFFV